MATEKDNMKWDSNRRCYISQDGKRYDMDGNELINPNLDDDFKDVAKLMTSW